MATTIRIDESAHRLTLSHAPENPDSPFAPVSLYSVIVYDPVFGEHSLPVYVIAESAERAIGQAQCVVGVQYKHCDESASRSTATRLPLALQGWGRQQFR